MQGYLLYRGSDCMNICQSFHTPVYIHVHVKYSKVKHGEQTHPPGTYVHCIYNQSLLFCTSNTWFPCGRNLTVADLRQCIVKCLIRNFAICNQSNPYTNMLKFPVLARYPSKQSQNSPYRCVKKNPISIYNHVQADLLQGML